MTGHLRRGPGGLGGRSPNKPGLAWLLERLGDQLPPQTRERLFEPIFEDNYQDYLISIGIPRRRRATKALFKVYYQARFAFWTYLLLAQCIRSPYRACEHDRGRVQG